MVCSSPRRSSPENVYQIGKTALLQMPFPISSTNASWGVKAPSEDLTLTESQRKIPYVERDDFYYGYVHFYIYTYVYQTVSVSVWGVSMRGKH